MFGVLAIGDLRLPFQILFCVFNSLQGFLIFILHVSNNDSVIEEWKGLISGKRRRMVSDVQKSRNDLDINCTGKSCIPRPNKLWIL